VRVTDCKVGNASIAFGRSGSAWASEDMSKPPRRPGLKSSSIMVIPCCCVTPTGGPWPKAGGSDERNCATNG